MENDGTFIRLVFEMDKYFSWEMCFETEKEKELFIAALNLEAPSVQFVCLSQPLEP